MEERRQLLKLVFSNVTIDGKSVYIQAQKPFDIIFKYANSLSWGRLVDLFRTRKIEFGITLPNIQLVLDEPKDSLSLA